MKATFITVLTLAALGLAQRATAAPLPATGAAKLAAYTVCRSLGQASLGEFGSNSSAECNGIVKNTGDGALLDNLAIRCLEESRARKDGYSFTGTCVETDADGDKIFLTYEGPESGPIHWLGGTGKYKDVTGEGTWKVADAPGNTPELFAFTLSYEMSWKSK